jgi:hypothetical protein
MTLVGDEENELDNIRVTANGRLFVSQNFTLAEGGATLILIDFGGVHLSYQPGPDRYTLTPQLRVVIELGSAEVEIDGIITD